ncbi:MAG: NDP-hexose 3-C-methyltransferase TylCIII [Candidatus Jorgensenbacteria bacterium GW2011_GWA2_45_13]|uniref:NDP-hexose 3-C-methyltransferase TylCIII n=1 Tax=Candidatus Jorgensenbacteria bacterium GW2011_GWA2_45_13 TaxID=1618662 RepID=A0A0G1NAM6_9BACT|nr:MAG: NDP-hexose 3-C-methyltransferase TylCIII [Candidatus Jorgensenbacteria bacterium GW2011_GWA2_45_13]
MSPKISVCIPTYNGEAFLENCLKSVLSQTIQDIEVVIADDIVPYVVDSTVTKQGKYIPLVNIKIISEEEGRGNPPDYYLLTIWNYKDEIIRKVRSWGNTKTKFILPHPKVQIIG